jgi:exodeoxyribonuclease VII small subunit
MPRPNSEKPVDAEASDAATIGELKFEAALAELEQIVQNMEGGRLPLEESLAAYRRGSELLRHCQQQLSDAERADPDSREWRAARFRARWRRNPDERRR